MTDALEENPTGSAESQDKNIDKLRVNLFSAWGEDSAKTEDNSSERIEQSRDSLVNYSSSDMSSEVEMLDPSTAHIEYN